VLDEHLAYHPTKEYITGPRELGITQEQIARLKKEGFKVLKVKIGIPFIPAFLIGFVVTIVWGSIVFLGVGLL
jgi:prepilin signal peptidase PulO-like enzyme (type II secretory pathway)